MVRVLVLVVGLAGCIRSSSVTCADGTECAPDTQCAIVQVNAVPVTYCVTPQQSSECAGMADGTACVLTMGPGSCHDSVCLPASCGNFLVDSGEACDDGNTTDGDGCSADCHSNETCGNGIVDVIRGEQCDTGDAQSHDGCSSDCMIETPNWELQPTSPPTRSEAPLVYDSRRHRVVTFGGFELQDTAEWDGERWFDVTLPVSPTPRGGYGLAYDAEHGVTVLFAGFGGSGDTWTWDGTRWTLMQPTTVPSDRFNPMMAYDPIRKQVIMFGGQGDDTVNLADTWAWDGSNWNKLAPATSPGPRRDAAFGFDSKRGVMVMFGGYVGPSGGESPVNETWEWNGTTWTQRMPSAPLPAQLAGAEMAFDPQRGTMVVFGGGPGAGVVSTTWEWNGTVWSHLSPGVVPNGDADFGMATDAAHDEIVMVPSQLAGLTTPAVYVWSNANWAAITLPTPPARIQQAIALDPVRHQVVMFGGQNTSNASIGDTWIWDGTWRQYLGAAPAVRYGAKMVYDRGHDELVMFGGYSTTSNVALQDTWVWKVDHWIAQTPVTLPPRRHDQSMVYDETHSQVVMFGGGPGSDNNDDGLQDTWTWDGTNWTPQTPAAQPSTRYGAAFGYDPIHQQVVLFGGGNDQGGGGATMTYGDTWLWDGHNWTQPPLTNQPTAKFYADMAWDASRGRLVMFGGRLSGGIFADSWEWDGTAWVQVPASNPATGIDYPAMTPNLDGAGVLCFGGSYVGSTIEVPDVRRLQWSSTTAAYETCDQLDDDHDGLVGCADPDCWWSCTPACPPHTTCPTGLPTCGDGTCNPALETCTSCTADCGACPDVCGDGACTGTESTTTCPGDC